MDDKLKIILAWAWSLDDQKSARVDAIEQIKRVFAEYALDIIGSDEDYRYESAGKSSFYMIRNELRAEQRLKVANGDSK